MIITNPAHKHSKVDCDQCSTKNKSVFCDLSDEAYALLETEKVTNIYKRGQYIFYSGNSPSGLYCVNSGIVKLESTGPQGQGHLLRVAKAGDVLGYRSLFADDCYEASAVVQEEAQICFVPKQILMSLIEKFPALSLRLLQRISKELRESEQRFCDQSDKNAKSRVAEAVLFFKEKYSEHTWTRREIAEWAGTTPETVMRTLAEFEDEGLIEQKGRQIIVKNRKSLFEKAELAL